MKIASFYSLAGTVQCAIFSLIVERDLNAWKLRLNMELLLIVITVRNLCTVIINLSSPLKHTHTLKIIIDCNLFFTCHAMVWNVGNLWECRPQQCSNLVHTHEGPFLRALVSTIQDFLGYLFRRRLLRKWSPLWKVIIKQEEHSLFLIS